MSLPAYLAPTASTRSKYQPKRTPTSSDHESSSSLVRRTSTSIKQLVNAATRTHHNHHGPEQTQSHSKRQPISSSTTPAVTTAKTTTTTQGRSSLESAAPTSKQQPSSSSSPPTTTTTTTDSHPPPHPPSSFRLKSAPNQPPQRTPSTTRTAKKTNVFGLSNTTDAARRMLSEPPLVVTCVPGRPITKYTKLAQKPAYTTSFVPIQPSVALLSSFTESTTSLASTLTLPSSSSRPHTPYSPSSSKSAPKTPEPPVPPLPSTATPKSPTVSADPYASSSTSPIPSPAPISAPTPAPPTRSTSLFKPTASSLSKANAPHRLSRQGIPTTTTTTTTTTATSAATKPAPQRAALPWLPPIDTTLHRPRPSIDSPQGPSAGVAKRISVDRSRPSLDRFRPSPTTDTPAAAAGTTTAHRQRPSVERASPTVAAGHGTRPSLGGRPSLDQQQQQPHPQPQQKYHYHKRGKTSISSPFSSSGTFRSSPGPYSTTVSVNNSSGSSNGGSSPSASEASKSPPQSPRSKIQAFKSLFTRKRSDSASVVSATTNATASTTTTGVSRPARHERGQSSLASLGGPTAGAGIISSTGANRRTPSPGASTALNLGGMHTGVALNKPKPLRGEGKKLEKPERKSEERERGRTASPGAAKELNRHIAGGSGMGADKAINNGPDMDVDCGPPALTSLRKVHENIPVHGCSILEAPYPYSYEEFILQAEQHTHDLLTTVMGIRVPLFVNPEHLSKAREVLDLGCGRGVWMTEAAKEWKNARFVGIDLIDVFPSPEHLHKRCGLTEGQAARVQFKQGNFLKGLPFENDRFDYVRMAFLEHAISEVKWPTVLADVVRVLRPGGTLEIITEELIFPSHADWDVYAVQKHLEEDFIRLLKRRRLLGAMEKMGELLFDAGFKMVERHTPLVVCKAPTIDARKRSGSYGRRMTPLSSPLDGSSSPLWSSTGSGAAPTSPAPHTGYMTARSCNMPALIVEPEVFIPVSDDVLFKYASHASMMLNAARHATFAQAYDDDDEERWREYRARVFEYERLMRLRLGIREKQFDFDEDDDDYDEARKVRPHSPLAAGHDAARWRWRGDPAADAEADRPLKIRSFRAWSSTKPLGPVVIPWLGAGLAA